MKFQKKLAVTALFAALAAASVVAQAQTVRIANQGDALSMDPHSLNESLQLSVTSNVYEPLVGRNKDLSLTPMLAPGRAPRGRHPAGIRPRRPRRWLRSRC